MNRQKVAWALVLVLALTVAGIWRLTVVLDNLIVIDYQYQSYPGWYYAGVVLSWVMLVIVGMPVLVFLGLIGITNFRNWRDSRAQAPGDETVVQ